MAQLQKRFVATRGASGLVNPRDLEMQSKRLDDIRKTYGGLLDAQGQFSVQGMKVTSATQSMTDALNRQKLSMIGAARNATVLKNVYKEQLALQQAAVIAWKRDGFGNIDADFIVPRELPKTVDTLGRRLAFMNTVLASNAQQMITWGKNTQWAGRQLMVGFTVPFGIVAAAAGKMAMQVDEQLTRIEKVYDTVATDAAGREAELSKLRAESYTMAANAANLYGASIEKTLDIEAGLAATGVRGADLVNRTNQIIRLATLGELEYQQALEMTIALQSAFGLSTEKITEKMNFMNAVENATSLSIANIAEAIPRAAASMAGLGVSVEEMIVLLVAMREKGVDAAEGANALKSAATRLLRPTPQAQEIFREKFGVDVMEIATRNAGNLFDILKELSTVMQGSDTVERAQALSALFGTYQFNRLNAALSGITEAMSGVGDQSSQTARAMAEMFQSPSEHAATADAELNRWQQSAAGKIKRAVQSFKVQLAELGESFLPIIAMIIKFGGKLIAWFNDLPSGVKNFVLIGAAIAAIAGPLVMIIGLTANLFGNLIKFGTFLAGFGLKFAIVNQHQQAAALLAKMSTVAFSDQARSAQLLATNLGMTNQMLAQNISLQAQIAGIRTGPKHAGAVSNSPLATPGYVPKHGAVTVDSASKASAANMAKIVGYTGAAALGMSLLTQNTNEFVGALQTAGILMLMLGPMFGGVLKKGLDAAKFAILGLGTRFASLGGTIGSKVGGAVASVGTGVKAVGGLLSAWAGPIGIAALALGALFLKVRTELKRAREEQEQLNNSANDWAEALGFVKLEYGQVKNDQGEIESSVKNVQKEMIEKNKSLVKTIRAAKTEQEALNIAIMEGIKVAQAGGSTDQARQAVEATLGMAFNDKRVQELMLKVDLDFSDAIESLEQQTALYADQFKKIMTNEFEQGGWEGFARIFTGTSELNERARAAATGMAQNFYGQIQLLGDQEKAKVFAQFQDLIASQQNAIFDSMGDKQRDALRAAGITTFEELRKLGEAVMQNYGVAIDKYGSEAVEAYLNNAEAIKIQEDAERTLAQEMLRAAGVTDDVIDKTHTLAQARRHLNVVYDVAEAESMYEIALRRSAMTGEEVTEAEQLRILNSYRLLAGLSAATSVEQGFRNSVDGTTDALDDSTSALEDNEQAMASWADSVVDATKGAFSGARDFALSVADDFLKQHHDSIIDGIRKGGERRDDALDAAAEAAEERFDARREASEARYEKSVQAFDARWERLMDKHTAKWEGRKDAAQAAADARIAAIDAQIEKERKLEETRQRIFQAEETRIKRLAQMFTMSVDLNAALNSGNLDEAARVMSAAQAQQDQYAIEDAGTIAGDASKLKIEALQAQRDKEQEALKARLDNLKKLEEAEKKALDKKKKLEQEALKHTRDMAMKALDEERKRYQKATQEARKANQQQTAAAVAAEQRRLDNKRRNLELELMAIRASTPRNKAEYDEQIRQIQAIYDKYGVNLKAKGNGWTKTIGNGLTANIAASAAKLQNDINWTKFAKNIAEKITSGAFGMTVAEFTKWVTTGEFVSKKNKQRSKPGSWWGAGATPFATGGYVTGPGGSTEDRVKAVLSPGEFVMNAKAVDRLGVSRLASMNNGASQDYVRGGKGGPYKKNIGGADLGLPGLFAGMMAGMMTSVLLQQILRAGMAQSMMFGSSFAAGKAGKYGGTVFSAEQLNNAAIIASVGRQLGGSHRDLVIALMTAMQESNLRNINYGDRDSIGLFQQRNAWGSREARLNPYESARMFFQGGKAGQRGLFDFKNRDRMSLTQAAQAVQVSAFPNAYAKWEDEARAILARGISAIAGSGGGGMGPGGWVRPLSGRVTSRYGMRKHPITGVYKLHDGTDIAAPVGTTIKAAQSGKVTRASYAGGYGNWTIIDHGSGYTTGYGHQSRFLAKAGQRVQRGQGIGAVGMTGNTTGPHLHFMVGKNGKWINPGSIIPGLRDGGTVRYDNTLANLHRRETVLTAPLSASLERGIRNLESAGNVTYNVGDVIVQNPADDLDVQKAVERAFINIEKKKGPKRKIGGNS